MVCASCAQVIEASLGDLDGGVHEARVNLATENAHVVYNPALVTISDIRAAVEDAGYQYLGGLEEEVTEDVEARMREEDLRDKFRRLTVGFAVSIPLFLYMLLGMPGGGRPPGLREPRHARHHPAGLPLRQRPPHLQGRGRRAPEPGADDGRHVRDGGSASHTAQASRHLRDRPHPPGV